MTRAHQPTDRRRVMRPRMAAVLLIGLALISCSGQSADPGTPPEGGAPEATMTTAPVARGDLTSLKRFPGWLGYGDTLPLAVGREGTLTWMPEVGTVIRLGEVLAEIDGSATRVLYGDRPAWRRLAVGEPDGADIRQLNNNLATLGYAKREDLSDDRFDWRTREAVREWQIDLGLRGTGVVEFGDVVFLPAEVRIGSQEAQPGMWVGAGQFLAYGTGTEPVVIVDLDPADMGTMSEGAPVVLVLPDRTRIGGTVRSIGRVVSAQDVDGAATVKVEIEPGDATSDRGTGSSMQAFDVAPVTVEVQLVLAEDVLLVPVGALLATAEAAYSVERITPGGVEMVVVEPGRFADGMVEISGDIGEGDMVVVPS